MSYPTDPIKDNVKMSKRPNVSVYFDNGVKWIQIGKLPGDGRSQDNISQANWVEIRIQLSSGCCCPVSCQAETGDCAVQIPRENDHHNSQALLCPFLSHHFWRPLCSLTAWSGRKCLTTGWESHHVSGSKKMRAVVVASGKTHQPSPVITEPQVWSSTQTQDVKVLFHKNHGKLRK